MMLLLNLKISRKACPLPWNLTRVCGLSIHIRSFLNDSTQWSMPRGFQLLPHAGILADLALWLWIRSLRIESMFQVVLWAEVPAAGG